MAVEFVPDPQGSKSAFNAITEVPNEFGLTGAYRFMGLITALWNAGRVQGIREERARRKRKAQTIEQ